MTRVAIAVGSLLVPLGLLFIGSARNENINYRLGDIGFLMSNWLYMAAPQLIVVVVSVVVRSARRNFLPWSLGALSLALVIFQCWIWWFVPVRESGLAWVLYVPISAAILAFSALVSVWRARFNNSLQRTPSAPAELDR